MITNETAKKTQQTSSLEIIGVLKWWYYQMDERSHVEDSVFTLEFQTPAAAKKFGTDFKLKNLGWWQTGEQHNYKDANDANDALRHGLLWLSKNGFEGVVRQSMEPKDGS